MTDKLVPLSSAEPGTLEAVNLPHRVFMYTVDQIAFIIDCKEQTVYDFYLHYNRRMVGRPPADRMLAHNIAPRGADPVWRVSEPELVRWLRFKGFRWARNGWK